MITQQNLKISHHKNRTDRILWSCNFGIVKQYFYTRREYKESDHRPVVSYFNVEVKKIDEAKKEEIFKQVYEVRYMNACRKGSS